MTSILLLAFSICSAANFAWVESCGFSENDFDNDLDYASFDKLEPLVQPKSRSSEETPESFSWVERGAVTEPRDQKACDVCWAFSIVGAFESALFLATKELKVLSPQNILDCYNVSEIDSPIVGNRPRGFKYVEKYGLQLESDYPYSTTCEIGTCKFDSSKSVLRVKKLGQLPRDDNRLRDYLLMTPISVSMFATDDLKYNYKGGIYSDPSCNNQPQNNHAVLLVGYGVENGTKYWLLKNSWGPKWGEKGYFRLNRDVPNFCGITKYAIIPFLY